MPGSRSGPANTVASWRDTILLGVLADDNLGNVLGAAGDVNGDGYADVIAGSTEADNGQANEGRASSTSAPPTRPGCARSAISAIESNTAGAALGTALAAAGDVNGDGFGGLRAWRRPASGGPTTGPCSSTTAGRAGRTARRTGP